MATNHVKRGAGRATHAARTAKHAQRRPFAPGSSGHETTVRIIAEEAAKMKETRIADRARRAASAAETAAGVEERRASDPMRKPKTYAEEARELGWETVGRKNGDDVTVTSTRGDETIVGVWSRGGAIAVSFTYTHGERVVKLRNASAAKQSMARTEEEAAGITEAATARRTPKGERPAKTSAEFAPAPRRPILPPGLLDMDDEHLLRCLSGSLLVWRRGIDGGFEEERFPRLTVEAKTAGMIGRSANGNRVVTFVSPGGGGFRSFAVESLVQIR